VESNINIRISSDLDALLKIGELSAFYIGLYDFLIMIAKNEYYSEYIDKLEKERKSWKVTVASNHRKTDNDFGSNLSKDEHKRLYRIQKSGDINKMWSVWDLLESFLLVAKNPVQTMTKRTSQKAWDFNQRKWDYQEVIGEKNKINDDINEFERDATKYKLAVKKLGNDFLDFLVEKENVIDFIGVRYDKRTCKLSFGKKVKIIPNDDQRIKFFDILARNNRSVGWKEVCKACLPDETYKLCSFDGHEDDFDFQDKAKDIKRNFVELLVSLGCKKGKIDKKLISNKNSGYLFVR